MLTLIYARTAMNGSVCLCACVCVCEVCVCLIGSKRSVHYVFSLKEKKKSRTSTFNKIIKKCKYLKLASMNITENQ